MSFLSEVFLLIAHFLYLITFFLLSFGLGIPFLKILRLKPRDDLLSIALSCGIGAWFFSQLVMALGFLGLISRVSILGLLSVLFLISLIAIRKWGEPLKHIRVGRPYSLLQKGLLLFFLLYLGICLLELSVPDLFHDSLKLHLYAPRLYLESGRIRFSSYNLTSAVPQNMEMLYLTGLASGEEGFARVPNIFFVFLSLLLLVTFAKEISGGEHTGLLTALTFLTFPVVFHDTVSAYVDVGLVFYGIATLFCLMKGHAEGNKKWFFVAGLLSAAALGIKYLYFIQLVTLNLLLICLWVLAPKEKRYPLFTPILIFTGTALLFGSSWYIRNYIVTKNPVYPFCYSLFGGPYWSQELEKGFSLLQYQFGPKRNFMNFLFLPFTLLREGFMLFALFPLLFLPIKKKTQWVYILGGLCLVEGAIWFFFLPFHMRYGIFWLTLWSILMGFALETLFWEKEYSPGFRKIIMITVIGLTIISMKGYLVFADRGVSIILGLKTREGLRLRHIESYAIMKYINEFVPADARIASFGDAQGYYCKRPFYPIHPGTSGYIDLNQMQDAEAYRQRLKEIGITHLIYNPRRTEIFRNRYSHWMELQGELKKRYLTFVRKENGVSLYRLK